MKYVVVTHHTDGCPIDVDVYESDKTQLVEVYVDYFMFKTNAVDSFDEEEIKEFEEDIHGCGVEVNGHFVFHSFEGTAVLYRQS